MDGQNKVNVSELPDDELIRLMHDVLNEIEARMKYRPVQLMPEEMAKLPY